MRRSRKESVLVKLSSYQGNTKVMMMIRTPIRDIARANCKGMNLWNISIITVLVYFTFEMFWQHQGFDRQNQWLSVHQHCPQCRLVDFASGRFIDSFSDTCKNFSLTISTKKSKVMYHPVPRNQHLHWQIATECCGQNHLVPEAHSPELSSHYFVNAWRINHSAVFGILHKNMCNRWDNTLETKIKVYQAVVLGTLLGEYCISTVFKESKPLSSIHFSNILSTKCQDNIQMYTVVMNCSELFSTFIQLSCQVT